MTSLVRTVNGDECLASLRNGYWEMMHNAALYSRIYGSVSLMDGFAAYTGPSRMLLCGYRVGASRLDIRLGLANVLRSLRQSHVGRVEFIDYWGPFEPLTGDECGLTQIASHGPHQSNVDVLLPLSRSVREEAYSRRCVRRAIGRGLGVSVNRTKTLTTAHADLFDMFVNTHDVDSSESDYLAAWNRVLAAPESVLLEVHQRSMLVGFVVMTMFGHVGTYAYGFFDRLVEGVSDLAHAAMLNFCVNRGARYLDLGYSINSSLLRYKLKWGCPVRVPPPWQVSWVVDGSAASARCLNASKLGEHRGNPRMKLIAIENH